MIIYLLAFLLVVFLLGYGRFLLDKRYNLPPGPLALPFVGSLYIFGKNAKGAPIFRDLSSKYGPIFLFYLGQYRMFILNTPEVIHEGIIGQSKTLNSRPTHLPGFTELKQAILVASGAKWQANRRFTMKSMREFGMGKMSIIEKLHDEIGHLLAEFELHAGKPTIPHKLITNAVSNIICAIVFGKRYEYNDARFMKFLTILDRIVARQFDKEAIFFMLPFLRYIKVHPQIADFNEMQAMITDTVQESLAEHRKDFDPENIRDFPDLFIQAELTNDGMDLETYVTLSFDMFGAGTETTATALNWTLFALCKYPDVQKKCHDTIDSVIDTDRLPTLADRPRLAYIDAVMCEILRFVTIVPMSLFHANLDGEAQIQGYEVPKSTVVAYNVWALHHDEKYWKKPEVFDPSRWLDENGKLLQHSSHFMAFGTGPRICLGESLARVEYFEFLVAILQRFSFTLADKDVTFDDGIAGVVNSPPKFRIIPSKR